MDQESRNDRLYVVATGALFGLCALDCFLLKATPSILAGAVWAAISLVFVVAYIGAPDIWISRLAAPLKLIWRVFGRAFSFGGMSD